VGAPITTFVTVNVNLTGGVAAKFGFGRAMGVFEHSVTTDRIAGPYFSLSEVTAAGFTSTATPEIYADATATFAQGSGVDQFLVGRRIGTNGAMAGQVWQVTSPATFVEQTDEFNGPGNADWDVLPAVDAAGNYAAIGYPATFGQISLDSLNGTAGTVGAVTWEYWDGAAWSALAGVVDGTTGFTAAVADNQVVTWTVPGDWAALALNGGPELFYVRAVSDGNYAVLPVYDQGFVESATNDATWTATMDAIETYQQVNGVSKDWYGHSIESRVKADILEVAAWTEAREKIFIAQSADADVLTGAAGNVMESLKDLGYVRTAGIYHATSTGSDGYLDGAWLSRGLGFNLDVPGGAGVWTNKQLSGVSGDNMTPTQATNIYADNGNIFTDAGELTFTSQGTMAAGVPRFIDVTTTIDWLVKRSTEAFLSLLVGTPTKIPYTNGGINQFVTTWQGVLDAGVTNSHLSEDTPPVITAPDARNVSDAVKQSRELTMSATATLAGAIQSVVVTLNLSF